MEPMAWKEPPNSSLAWPAAEATLLPELQSALACWRYPGLVWLVWHEQAMSSVTQAVTQKREQAVNIQQLDLAVVFRHLLWPFQEFSWELVWLENMGLVSLRSPMVVSGRLETLHVLQEVNT